MDTDKITVAVHRELFERSEGMELTAFLDSVYEAVVRNFAQFEADEKYHVWPEEVRSDSVIVRNSPKRAYYRAAVATDTEGNVSISNIERVKKQWVPFGETVERSEDGELQTEFAPVDMKTRKGFWGAVL